MLDNLSKYVVGLMSGTSLDGIDAALVKITGKDHSLRVELISFSSLPFTSDMKDKLVELCVPETSRLQDISGMNVLLGKLFAEAALNVIVKSGLTPKDILLISSHGQTIFHQPYSVSIAGHNVASTLQIGDISVIAERTGIITVGDFRPRDMAAGGQGAPLVPYADYLLFKEKKYGRVLVNIGGIANITVLPENCSETEVIAYDTGPGNMLIDAFTNWATDGNQLYDKEGSLAALGKVNKSWLQQLLQHDYFKLSPPKSTGRELFGTDFAKILWDEAEKSHVSNVDKMATITDLTAITIVQEIVKFVEKGKIAEVLISGGGRYNHTLMKQISNHLPQKITVKGTEDYGMPSDAKEAIVFALLGYQCYYKTPNNLPSATGAKHSVVMGKMAW